MTIAQAVLFGAVAVALGWTALAFTGWTTCDSSVEWMPGVGLILFVGFVLVPLTIYFRPLRPGLAAAALIILVLGILSLAFMPVSTCD